MAELNEEQLLLLNNLMYYDKSINLGSVKEIATTLKLTLKDMIADPKGYGENNKDLFSGGFEKEEQWKNMLEITESILADSELCNLRVTNSTESEGVRASCFVDQDGNATVAIRGTGGTYEAWSDNIEGAYGTGTACQEEFRDFIKSLDGKYDNITVTGHSKGGNLAQYATIIEGDMIDRCVSFDGQGFNEAFREKYADEITANRDKIKSICGDKDYVNILLDSIAGETVYLDTTDGENAHSSYALWEANKGTMMRGEYSNTMQQSKMIGMIDGLADGIVDLVGFLPDNLEVALVQWIGSAVGTFFAFSTKQMSYEDFLDVLKHSTGLINNIYKVLPDDILKKIWNLIDSLVIDNTGYSIKEEVNISHDNGSRQFKMKSASMGQFIGEFEQYERQLKCLIDEVDNISLGSYVYNIVNVQLKHCKDQIRAKQIKMNKLHTTLVEIREKYETTEMKICNNCH